MAGRQSGFCAPDLKVPQSHCGGHQDMPSCRRLGHTHLKNGRHGKGAFEIEDSAAGLRTDVFSCPELEEELAGGDMHVSFLF